MSTPLLKLFEAAITQAWNAIVITDADIAVGCRVQFANPAFTAMTGYSLDELRGHSLRILQGPDTDPALIDELRICLKEARLFEGTATNYRKDGSSYTVRWSISPVRDDSGLVTNFVSVQQDISDYEQAEQTNRLLARALDATSDPVMLTDAKARIIFANAAFAKSTGYTVDEIQGSTPAMFKSGKHDEAFYAAMRRSLASGQNFRATFINRRRDGSLYHAEQSISPIFGEKGRISHYVSVSKDITKRVEREQALLRAATKDKLTGLHNRHHGEQLLAERYRTARTLQRPLTLVMCDIDHFKRINDEFGHPTGDRVLAEVADMLRQAVRSRDAVIRWGGEEFMIVLDECSQTDTVDLAKRILDRVNAHEDGEVPALTLSLGLATLAPDEAIDELIARADSALYDAKRAGRNRLSIAA
ncbi:MULTISPECIES: sensor domain-containing diguanylate cyclase [Ralstonia]|jgi:diguanylate cyclase (GGDEF)-like protein/PAS domain S-box-containing protein|uniref:Diguanylate cyclase with PAS/PAC sensor n=1 Tax=Ralstonia pickettii OR214 TaxID=1264675 RepID=R0CTW4_RALPI|nr:MULTISPECIES: sensor domain-containing diguanylate cyclase [Ralstonia]MEA3269246.1 diguanylate cyclase [Pseudomonadota bacterium]ENZ79830.1 diguanylate cyclase with PAS/PAC sensor [Ralstonia pickettii OR214]MBL4779466.1 diguanylate cyclase [Ralstonia sp.]MCM3581797.1 diguanylate cyclase [Ralstonia pickettii]MDR9383160.1 diguanylate cyclase [Ralstonia sp. 11b]